MLDGEDFKLVISRDISNASNFCEFKCFECLIYMDETAPFPNNEFKHGRYLSPNFDVGPTMMAKLLTANNQVLH